MEPRSNSTFQSSRPMAGLMMELQQLIVPKRQGSVGPPFVIAEFDLVHTGCEPFNDGSNLAAQKRMVRDVFQQCDH